MATDGLDEQAVFEVARKLENREKLVTETLQSYTGLEEFPEMAAKLQAGGGPKLPGPLSGLGGGLPGFNPFKK